MNMQRFRQVLAAIEANPRHWDQTIWHCDTTHCFAGHAQLLMRGLPADAGFGARYAAGAGSFNVEYDACKFLEISGDKAEWLFSGARTLDDFRTVARRPYA